MFEAQSQGGSAGFGSVFDAFISMIRSTILLSFFNKVIFSCFKH